MFIPSLEHTLRGFSFESSGFDKAAFYVWAFFLPLHVPRKYLSFNLGHRVGSGWEISNPTLDRELSSAMQKEVHPLVSLKTPENVIEAIRLQLGDYKDLYSHEALAYMLAYSGDTRASLEALGYLLRLLNPAVRWQQEMASRALLLREKLLRDPNEARDQLVIWRAETLHNLGLEEFCACLSKSPNSKAKS